MKVDTDQIDTKAAANGKEEKDKKSDSADPIDSEAVAKDNESEEKKLETKTASNDNDEEKETAAEPTNKTKTKNPSKKTKKTTGSTMDRWNARFEECKAFAKKHGHCKIPTRSKDNKALGLWVQETRRNYKLMATGGKPRRILSDEQIEKLNEVGFDWGFTPDPTKMKESDSSWSSNFAKLKEYKDSNGDFDVPMDGSLSKLAKWAIVQRHQNNLRVTKRKTFLTKDHVKQLNSIGFNWDGPRKLDG